MVRIFSKRHERAIFDRALQLSLARRLRRRIWYALQKHNFEFHYQPDPSNNWVECTDALTEIKQELKERYGVKALAALRDDGTKGEVDLEGFVIGAYPAQVLDVVELLYDRLEPDKKLPFQSEINNIFEEEDSEWRLTDGLFFKVDSEFLSLHVVAKSYQLLKAEGFEGALDEFNEAWNDLVSGDYKGAIINAGKSFESVLKTILEKEEGNASALIREVIGQTGFAADLPERVRTPFGEQVLNSLPFLRNNLSGHGQGTEVVEAPRLYAELALHIAAAFNMFAVQKAIEMKPRKDGGEGSDSDASDLDDDIPF